jgi:hypothetical protein
VGSKNAANFLADSRPILIASDGERFSQDCKISFLDLFNDTVLSASLQRQMARPLRKCFKKDVEENVSCLRQMVSGQYLPEATAKD